MNFGVNINSFSLLLDEGVSSLHRTLRTTLGIVMSLLHPLLATLFLERKKQKLAKRFVLSGGQKRSFLDRRGQPNKTWL